MLCSFPLLSWFFLCEVMAAQIRHNMPPLKQQRLTICYAMMQMIHVKHKSEGHQRFNYLHCSGGRILMLKIKLQFKYKQTFFIIIITD